jgi:hypothetical protein
MKNLNFTIGTVLMFLGRVDNEWHLALLPTMLQVLMNYRC